MNQVFLYFIYADTVYLFIMKDSCSYIPVKEYKQTLSVVGGGRRWILLFDAINFTASQTDIL